MTFHCLGECVSFGLWPFWMSPSRNSHHTRQHGTDDGRDVKCQQHANAMYFYPRDALLTATAVYAVALSPSVRPYVCLSVTSRHCTKTAKRGITKTTPYDSTVAVEVCWQQLRPIWQQQCWSSWKFVYHTYARLISPIIAYSLSDSRAYCNNACTKLCR